MDKKLNAVFDKKTGTALLAAGTHCAGCGQTLQIARAAVIKVWHHPKNVIALCFNCSKKTDKKFGQPDQKLVVVVASKLPADGVVMDLGKKTGLQNTQMDVWETEKLEGATIDKTKFAGRIEFSQMELPQRPSLEQIDMGNNQPATNAEIDDFFTSRTPVKKDFKLLDHILPPEPSWEEEHGNTQTAIEDKKTKQIEDKNV